MATTRGTHGKGRPRARARGTRSSSRNAAASQGNTPQGSVPSTPPSTGPATPAIPAPSLPPVPGAVLPAPAQGQGEFDGESILEFSLEQSQVAAARANAALDILLNWNRGDPKDPDRKQVCIPCVDLVEAGSPEVNDGRVIAYGGRTSTTVLRGHTLKYHLPLWISQCEQFGWDDLLHKYVYFTEDGEMQPTPAFTMALFENALVRFIASDDQSLRLVENVEFRRLLLLLRPSLRTEGGIPGRTKMTSLVLSDFQKVIAAIQANLASSLGTISLTTDTWSDSAMKQYMALTTHSLGRGTRGELVQKAILIGFHVLEGKHDADNLAATLVKLTDRVGITDRIGWVTSDNAAVNTAMMRSLSSVLKAKFGDDFDFDPVDRRIMCLPHALHLCVAAIIKYVEKHGRMPDENEDLDDDDGDDSVDTGTTTERLFPLALLRTIINTIRKTGRRRADFKKTIEVVNSRGDSNKPMSILELLRDVPHRWDSTYLMINRARTLRRAIDYHCKTTPELEKYTLTPEEWSVLNDLGMVLYVPWKFSTRLTMEQLPSLVYGISSFERLLTSWEEMDEKLQSRMPLGRSAGIQRLAFIGRNKGLKYYNKLDDSAAYAICMFLDPTVRFTWFSKNWDVDYQTIARGSILRTMQKYAAKILSSVQDRSSNPVAAPQASTSRPVVDIPTFSADADTTFDEFGDNSFSTIGAALNLSSRDLGDTTPARGDPIRDIRDQQQAAMTMARHEFDLYCNFSDNHRDKPILDFWSQIGVQFPILLQVSYDYLPIQASSVPCERAFSSCAETDTKRRNRLASSTVEALQILKGYYKQDQTMDFVSAWTSTERELTSLEPERDYLADLAVADGDSAARLAQVLQALRDEEGVLDSEV